MNFAARARLEKSGYNPAAIIDAHRIDCKIIPREQLRGAFDSSLKVSPAGAFTSAGKENRRLAVAELAESFVRYGTLAARSLGSRSIREEARKNWLSLSLSFCETE